MDIPRRVFVIFALCLPAAVIATEQVYVPINPSFGGNPLNGSVLLNSAQAQNHYKEPSASPLSLRQSALQQFNETLQRSILSRVASAVSSGVVGTNGQLSPGTVETTDFRIVISDIGGGTLHITTTDKVTGQTTEFQISP